MKSLHEFSGKKSPDPIFAVLTTLIFVLAVSATPPGVWWAYALYAGAVALAALVTRAGLYHLMKRVLWVLPFSLAAVPTIFTKPGNLLWEAEVSSFWTLSVSDVGVIFASSVILKASISAMAVAVLMRAVPFNEILSVMRKFKTPPVIVAITASTYRYIHLMLEEARRMMDAKKSRSAAIKGIRSGGNLRWHSTVLGNMAGFFFLRTLQRTERVHAAMLSRGYDYFSEPIREKGSGVSAKTVFFVLIAGAGICTVPALAHIL